MNIDGLQSLGFGGDAARDPSENQCQKLLDKFSHWRYKSSLSEKNMFMEGTSQEHLLMAGEKNILIEGTSRVHLSMAGEKHSQKWYW
jgi:hypothetical protein